MEEDHEWRVGWFSKFGIPKRSAEEYAAAFNEAGVIESVLEKQAKDEAVFNQSLMRLGLKSFHQEAIRLGLLEQSWEIGRYRLEPKDIGNGTYGTVYKAFTRDNDVVAIKKFRGDSLISELQMMHLPAHDNVVSILDFYTDDRKVASMVMEYLPFNLKAFITHHLKQVGALTVEEIRFFLLQIALGLEHLHDNNVTHRDIKGQNVLVKPSDPLTLSKVKVSDFGTTKIMKDASMARTIELGSPGFTAPEIRIDGQGNPSSYDPFLADVYSFGGIVYELLTGSIPWKPSGPIKELPLPNSMAQEDRRFFRTLYSSCRQHNPLLRPNVFDLVDVLKEEEPMWILIHHHIVAVQSTIRGFAVRKRMKMEKCAASSLNNTSSSEPDVHAEAFEKSNAMLTSMYDRCTAVHPEDRPTITALLVETTSLNAAPPSGSSLSQNADVSLERPPASSLLDVMKPSSTHEATSSEMSALDRGTPASGSSEGVVPHSGPSHMVSGSVYTWGDNRNKKLGYDTSEEVTSVPRMISQLTKIIQIAAGEYHCLALSEDGDVMSWGTGDKGQLGIENVKQRTAPMKINMSERIMSIAAGYDFSLAMSANHVYSWGDNLLGQLGQGPGAPKVISVPREIQGLKAGIKICAGSSHVMLLTREGHLIAWGDNGDGQLGVGDDIDRDVPVPVKCEVSFTDISVGNIHNLGVSSTGQLYSWGYNKHGQLGLGDSNDRYVPTVVPNCPVFDSIQAVWWRSFGLHGTTLYQWGDKIGNIPEKAEGRWNRFAGHAAVSEVTMPSQSLWNKLFGQRRTSSDALLFCDLSKKNFRGSITYHRGHYWNEVEMIICHKP
eukprot:TRINITY_DN2102_c0_g1_i9.p1 TRINITY_DN2102_c0_g1~~TRINITY_DN2102_c0_g1_i9.p1  ORF type:complete len:832 (-),score=159.19 TRINITY_DN2102_c0_g1_i9:24-2519(-)